MKTIFQFVICVTTQITCFSQTDNLYKEQYRSQVHFSPKAHWMNDPNGMVYNNGVYHLFFQYYPDSTVWGPMHWGHAVSPDMIHWKEKTIALNPDSIGYIFSGSAVIDKNNTSGFGKNGKAPMVAIFTQHNPVGEKQKNNVFQNQSIAYSIDDGKTWVKYNHNPVLKNPGVADFRDPKVIWYEEEKKWVMILAVKDHVSIYSSPDLKIWTKESDFGEHIGAHGGVWECPDIFSLNDAGKKVWIITSSINPGAPNGGSGTQYFIGTFNGKTFTTTDTTKWIDYGTDDYAGVTWSNTANRKLFLGWMSNWNYATVVPTVKWRSAMTVPRELRLKKIDGTYYLASSPVQELSEDAPVKIFSNINTSDNNLNKLSVITTPCILKFTIEELKNFACKIFNDAGEELIIGFDKQENRFYIDRTKTGKTDFNKDFAARSFTPRIVQNVASDITMIIDNASVEFFADNGLTTMTEIFFPSTLFNHINIQSPENAALKKIEIYTTKKYLVLKRLISKTLII